MKATIRTFFVLLLVTDLGITREQQHSNDACMFSVLGEPAHATITGPNEILPLVYLVEQPDSPLEILSVDLVGTQLSVSSEQFTVRDCATYQVRNRSDRIIRRFTVGLRVTNNAGGAIGAEAHNASPLAPGQTAETKTCGGGGHGGAPAGYLRLIVSVESVDLGDCLYRPSLRIPSRLGVGPVW
jgi:hypothetical protein